MNYDDKCKANLFVTKKLTEGKEPLCIPGKLGTFFFIVIVHVCPFPPPPQQLSGGDNEENWSTFGFCLAFKLIPSHTDVGKWPLLSN